MFAYAEKCLLSVSEREALLFPFLLPCMNCRAINRVSAGPGSGESAYLLSGIFVQDRTGEIAWI
jgi:hypothetical protein